MQRPMEKSVQDKREQMKVVQEMKGIHLRVQKAKQKFEIGK